MSTIIRNIAEKVYSVLNEGFDFSKISDREIASQEIITAIHFQNTLPDIFKQVFGKKLPVAIKPYNMYNTIGWVYSKSPEPFKYVKRKTTDSLNIMGIKKDYQSKFVFDNVWHNTLTYSHFTYGHIKNMDPTVHKLISTILADIFGEDRVQDKFEYDVQAVYYNDNNPLVCLKFR